MDTKETEQNNNEKPQGESKDVEQNKEAVATPGEDQQADSATEVAEDKGTKKDSNKKTMMIVGAVLVAVLAIGGAAYYSGALPFLGGSTSEVLARVNGEEITRAQLDSRIEQNRTVYENQGANLDDPATYAQVEKQALDFLINETLILQAATDQGITATTEEVQGQFDETTGNFESEEALEQALVENSLTRELLRTNIERRLVVEKYIDANVNEEAANVSEEEVQEFYDNYQAQNPEAPALDELRPQIEQLLREQKVQKEVEGIVQELRENANIEVLLQ
ncbi:MAG: SurA N-terminal domain-containing protein [Candidatus Spechtbacterales bacterium]|nr:SurA N-terminal domain-containing protein [Candidatus Spechtbacterales bacterium]